MIIRTKPDRHKSESLMKMAGITLERLEKTDMEKYPSNTLLDYYDAAHKLLEAIASKEGIKTKGEGAHQELIDYISKQHNLGEQTRQLLQKMRDYRNRISYEGFEVNKNYIVLNNEKIKETLNKLSEKLN